MPVETFNYLDSLNPTFPPTSDGLVGGDDHIRGIKASLKATFPNISGAVTASQDAINTAAGWASTGSPVLKGSGTFFNVNTTDGFLNTLAGDIDVQLQGVLAATFQRAGGVNTFKVSGGIQATGEIKGPGITPIGACVMWFDDMLPTDGLWVWANGQVIANANVVAPVLLARWGTKFGGNGSTTLGVPNLCEVVPAGQRSMGGAANRAILSTGAINNTPFGATTVTLSTSNLPPYTPSGSVSTLISGTSSLGAMLRNTIGSTNLRTGTDGANVPAYVPDTQLALTPSSSLSMSAQGGTSTPFSIVQPTLAVNWIIRIG